MAGFCSIFKGWVRVGGGCCGVRDLDFFLSPFVSLGSADFEKNRWLATEQTKFMNGRYMGVNWDVDQLAESRHSRTGG